MQYSLKPEAQKRANDAYLRPTNKIYGNEKEADEHESVEQKTVAIDECKWHWSKGLAHRFLNHWTYMNIYLSLSFIACLFSAYSMWQVFKLNAAVREVAVLGGNAPADILLEMDNGFRQLRNELKQEIQVFNSDLSADVKKEISSLKNFSARKQTENKDQLSFLDSRLSKLHISVRKLIQTVREQTIIGAHCNNADLNGLDDFDDIEGGNPFTE